MKSLKEINERKESALQSLHGSDGLRVVVGMATCGLSAGANPVYQALKNGVEEKKLKHVAVSPTGCIGMCTYEPIVEV